MITVSNTYTLSYLAKHELTKEIISKYLKALVIDEEQLQNVDATLQELYSYNMGGGIPHDVIVALMSELDRLPVPLEQALV